MTYDEAIKKHDLINEYKFLCKKFVKSKKLIKFVKKMNNQQIAQAIVIMKYKIKSL
jgi:flagellar motility protein MotE (MotC chaperone)